MTRHRKNFQGVKSIAGTLFVALGAFILYAHLLEGVSWLKCILAQNGSDPLGIMLAITQVLSPVAHAFGVDHQRLVAGVLQHTLGLSWPLVLAMVGTVLSRDAFVDNAGSLTKKECGLVDLAGPRSTSK